MEQSNPHTRLSQFVRSRRLDLGLTAGQLAELSGVDPGGISRIEAGRKIPTPETLAAMATALQVSLDELYDLAGYPVPELPALRPYLRRAYGVPDQAAEEVERYLQQIGARYGGASRPAPGEDEQPEK